MSREELARKALDTIKSTTFTVELFASEGGPCGGGWDDCNELSLSKKQLVYLVHEHVGYDSLFEGMEEKEVNVEETLMRMACNGAWPDSDPSATVNDVVPEELADLGEELDELDEDDLEAVERVRKQLSEIESGSYTFSFTIECMDYCMEEDARETFELTGDQVRGLLLGEYSLPAVFEGICDKPLSERFLNLLAAKADIASDYDPFSYGGNCDMLENYLNGWELFLERILEGNIDEDEYERCLSYFEDPINFESDFEEWLTDWEEEE